MAFQVSNTSSTIQSYLQKINPSSTSANRTDVVSCRYVGPMDLTPRLVAATTIGLAAMVVKASSQENIEASEINIPQVKFAVAFSHFTLQ